MKKILTLSTSAVFAFLLVFGISMVLNNQQASAYSGADVKNDAPKVKETKKEEPKYSMLHNQATAIHY